MFNTRTQLFEKHLEIKVMDHSQKASSIYNMNVITWYPLIN